jgi:hypothetical protein
LGGEGLKLVEVVASENRVDVCMLGHVDGACMLISLNLHSEHPMKLTQISDFYVLVEASLELINEV